jgi:hypothetical protein
MLRPAGICFSIALLATGLIDQASAVLNLPWPSRLLLATGGVVVWFLSRRRPPPASTSAAVAGDALDHHAPPSGRPLTDEEIFNSVKAVWDRFVPKASGTRTADHAVVLTCFADLMTDNRCITEATEDVEVVGELLRSVVTLEVSFPDRVESAAGSTLILPVPRRKRNVFDALEIADASGEKRLPLSVELTRGLLAFTLMRLVDKLFHDKIEKNQRFAVPEQVALYELVRLVCEDDELDDEHLKVRFDHAVAGVSWGNEQARKRLFNFCRYFAKNTVMAVPVKAPDECLWVRFTEVPAPPARVATRKDRLRTRIGLWPYWYEMELRYPFYAARYNLRFSGPGSQFVYRHFVRDGAGQMVRSDTPGRNWLTVAATDSRIDLAPELGMPFTTMTMSGMNRADPRRLDYAVLFEEVPPGALGRSAVISSACTLLVLTFALVLPHVGSEVGIDLAALLLTLPLFAATWTGQSPEKVQQSSLTAYAGLAGAGLVSFAAAVLYLVQAATWKHLSIEGLTVLGLLPLPPVDLVWISLAACSTVATAMLLARYRRRAHRYLQKVHKRSAERQT